MEISREVIPHIIHFYSKSERCLFIYLFLFVSWQHRDPVLKRTAFILKMPIPSHPRSLITFVVCWVVGAAGEIHLIALFLLWIFDFTFFLFITHTFFLVQFFWMLSTYTGKYSFSFKKNCLLFLNESTCTVTFILQTAPPGIHLSSGRNLFDAVGSSLLKMLIIKRMCAMKKPCRYYLTVEHLHCRWDSHNNFKFL